MQTIWKGTVSFGLVSIPVRLYAATEERDVSFRQVHRTDGGRIRYKRVCEVDGEEVTYGDIAKGYEMPDGEMVTLEKSDFETLPLPSSRVIDVVQFVPVDQLDPLMMARAYYLSADGPGAKPYVLLRDALAATDRVAIVKVALRNREQLAAVRARGDVLVLQTMLWPDEVRDSASVAPDADVTVREQEAAMAESYIETLTADFEPDEFTDEYRHALEELIESKATGIAPPEVEAAPVSDGNVVDLMAALRASVDAAKARRSGGGQAAAERVADAEGDADAGASSGRSGARKSAGAKKATSAPKAAKAAAAAPGKSTPAKRPAAKATKTAKSAAAKAPAKTAARARKSA